MMQIVMYLLVFFVKIIEVTLATTRIVLITRGERLKGAFIGFFEVTIWIILVSTVMTDLMEDPIKVVIYALGFSIGNYVGSMFEERLGIGTSRVEAIVLAEHGKELVDEIRSHGFAVTVVVGQGMNYERNVLIMHVKRKRTKEVIDLIKKYQDNVVITVNEIKPVYGGFGTLKK